MDGPSENTSVLFPFRVETQWATLLIITAFYEAILDYFKYLYICFVVQVSAINNSWFI